MDLEKVIRELEAERDELRRAIDAVERLEALQKPRTHVPHERRRQPPPRKVPEARDSDE